MSLARNLSKFKPSSSGLVETADIADDAVSTDQIANNAIINTSGAVTTTGAFTSVGIDDNADATAMTIDSSEKVGLGTTTPATSLEISGTTANTQGGVFPRVQISTLADNNPTYAGALDVVEKQSGASSTAVFGSSGIYGFRTMLDGNTNSLKWQSGSQTTVTDRVALARDTGDLTLNTGNLVIGTAGKGIDFSAQTSASSASASATGELFDRYEEGIFTHSGNANMSINSVSSRGFYQIIGNRCFVNGFVRFTHSGTNNVFLYLPVASKADITSPANGEQESATACWFPTVNTSGGLGGVVIAYVASAGGAIFFYNTGTASGLINNNNLDSTAEVYYNLNYVIA